MLGDIRHDLVQTHLRRLDDLQVGELDAGFAILEERARTLIEAEDGDGTWRHERSLDARFEGQLFEMNLPVAPGDAPSADDLDAAFRDAYRETYGYGLPNHKVQLVNLRLVASSVVHDGGWPCLALDMEDATGRSRQVIGEDGSRREVPVWRRNALREGLSLDGPAIIEDFGATIRLLAGQRLEVRPSGMLELIERDAAA
jgi:N-methylhydantoinase A